MSKNPLLTMELKSVTDGTLGLAIFELPGGWYFEVQKKNAADLEMYIFSRYLKETSIIYN